MEYLIPIEVVEQSKEKVSTNEMKKYLENWSIFDKYLKYWSIFGELVNQKLRTLVIHIHLLTTLF